jgi:hypothetical protein
VTNPARPRVSSVFSTFTTRMPRRSAEPVFHGRCEKELSTKTAYVLPSGCPECLATISG